MRISVDQADVEGAIESYIREPGNDPAQVVAAARTHRLLPLWKDIGGCILLRADGELLAFGWDTPTRLEAIRDDSPDRSIIHAARGWASRRFPDVRGLRPERGPSSIECPTCKGTGQLVGFPENLTCACGGLGWIPIEAGRLTSA
jgi:glycine/D-amino acid oxidase-like deaminating enzyme